MIWKNVSVEVWLQSWRVEGEHKLIKSKHRCLWGRAWCSPGVKPGLSECQVSLHPEWGLAPHPRRALLSQDGARASDKDLGCARAVRWLRQILNNKAEESYRTLETWTGSPRTIPGNQANVRIAEETQALPTPTNIYLPSTYCVASAVLRVFHAFFFHVFLTTLWVGLIF